ncbi:MAG: putative metal-dependent hydrolase [Acidimicrobiales bacterium]|nr:putative metal-dependent hydrolase [Acidimicrobiales bacterium]
MDVEVIRSAKRRKTVQARLVGGRLELRIPGRMSAREEAHWVAEMTRRFRRAADTERIDLRTRAALLSRRHDLPVATSVRWVANQRHRWGSCTPSTGDIRISDRLAPWPEWVLDYVLVHELAHLVESGHGRAFNALVDRYPLAERARGYLLAKAGADDADADADDGVDAHAGSATDGG